MLNEVAFRMKYFPGIGESRYPFFAFYSWISGFSISQCVSVSTLIFSNFFITNKFLNNNLRLLIVTFKLNQDAMRFEKKSIKL